MPALVEVFYQMKRTILLVRVECRKQVKHGVTTARDRVKVIYRMLDSGSRKHIKHGIAALALSMDSS